MTSSHSDGEADGRHRVRDDIDGVENMLVGIVQPVPFRIERGTGRGRGVGDEARLRPGGGIERDDTVVAGPVQNLAPPARPRESQASEG